MPFLGRSAKRRILAPEDIPDDPERPGTVLVYRSRRGSALQYARWIVEELDCDVMPFSRRWLGHVILYRTVVFLSWARAGEIVGLGLLRACAERFLLPTKELWVVAVGASGPTPGVMARLRERNLSGGIAHASLWTLPGRHAPGKDRLLKWAYGRGMYDGLGPTDAAVLRERLAEGFDGVDRSALAPLLQALRPAP